MDGKTRSQVFDVSIHAPVRVRRMLFLILTGMRSFNSRTREGATDGEGVDNLKVLFQFTHP